MSPSAPAALPRLLPSPRVLELRPGGWELPATLGLSAGDLPREHPGLERLQRALARHGCALGAEGPALLGGLRLAADPALGPEAYQLAIESSGVRLRAGDGAGLYYGLCTLAQLLDGLAGEATPRRMPALFIDDAPDFAERGVLLDVARDRRPTLATLRELVTRLSSWKINRLQLYMEADFAFADCDEVLAGRSPYRPEELRELDAFCRAHYVELVPNQQSFGHLHHWLRHPRWRGLAEVPDGVLHPFSREREPFSLAPTEPRALEFLERLYGQLLPCFSSATLNVGFDETFDLGRGRSRAACLARGRGRVYLDFLLAVRDLAARHGKRIQYWGDVVLEHPELIPELPPDATAMVWGYEADFPFAAQLPAFAESGLSFQVCPGTSSWNSFGGRCANALANLKRAAREAQRHGAAGLLVTDWGDRGHLQTYPTSFLGFAVGAACAWNVADGQSIELETARELLDRYAFEDRAGVLGRAALALGRAGDVLGDACVNGHALFFAVTFAREVFPHPRIVGLTRAGLDASQEHLALALEDLGSARSARSDGALLAAELELARELLLLGAALSRARLELPAPNRLCDLGSGPRAELAAQLEALCARHAELWPRRYRPGGLEDSLRWLDFLRPG